MPSCAARWIGAALGLAVGAAGCADGGARTYAVVLEEPPELDCTGTPELPFEGYQLLNQLQRSWHDQYASGSFRPVGGVFHVVPARESVLAWFNDFQQYPYYVWNEAMFEGELHDGYVEAAMAVTHDPNLNDPDDLFPDCPEVTDVRGELLATIDGAQLEGRIRRTEAIYYPSAFSACGTFILCARNIAVIGAEEH
jgi:hypothetical protein